MRHLIPSLLLATVLAPAMFAQQANIRFGTVDGQPGEIVEIPVRCTFDMTLIGAWMSFTFDPARIEPLSYSVKDTAAAGANPYSLFVLLFGNQGQCGISRRERGARVNPGPLQVPPGANVLIGKLVVRIRADAALGETPVPPTEIFRNAATVIHFWDGTTTVPARSITYSPGGGVNVLQPQGPRPVGNLRCAQFLDQAVLSYSLTETYDSIEVFRDGSRVATIPGTQTEFSEPVASIARREYAVVAVRGGNASIPVRCELIPTTPSAPGVTELVCGDSGLSWKNPVAFDAIGILRDGVEIASLPGTATSYVDPNRPPNVTLYAVVSRLRGFRSPDVTCVDNGVWVIEIRDVQVPIDATEVTIPIVATTATIVAGFSVALAIDQSRFELLQGDPDRSIRDTVVYQEPDWLVVNINPLTGLPTASVIFDMTPSWAELDKWLVPGLRQNVLNFFFKPKGVFSAGDTFPVGFQEVTFSTGGVSARLDFLIDGQITFGSPGVPEVGKLSARAMSGGRKADSYDVVLSWTNQASYDKILVERNGAALVELPGTATSHRDPGLGSSVYTYKIVAQRNGVASFPANVFVSTVASGRTFLRCDANRDGRINIGDAILLLHHVLRGGVSLPCEDAADANDDGILAIADPIFILGYVFGGGVTVKSPGAQYPWFDPTPDGLGCEE